MEEVRDGAGVKKAKRAFDKLSEENVTEKNKTALISGKFWKGFDDSEIFVYEWAKVSQPLGVVLIFHGMVEHGLRYYEFARYLNDIGFIVVVPDARGHGRTAGSPGKVGIYKGDIFGDTVRDNIKFAEELIARYKLPLFVLGHSYGSFICQSFIQNYHAHTAAVLIGSSCYKGRLDPFFGKIVADITKTFKKHYAKSDFIYNMTFGAYEKQSGGNWLTSDMEKLNEYNLDPYCGAVCSASFYSSFFGWLKKIYKPSALSQVDKDKPLLITSGEQDPVGGKNHSLIDKLKPLYEKYGVRDVEYKLWGGGKHEILNETFRREVFVFIGNFLIKQIAN